RYIRRWMLEFVTGIGLEAQSALPGLVAHSEQIIPVVKGGRRPAFGAGLATNTSGDQIPAPTVGGCIAEGSGKSVREWPRTMLTDAGAGQRTTVSALDQTRTTDLLGHVYLQGGDFARAADLFGAAREHAQMAGAPLWMAGALRHLTLALMGLEPEAARQVLPQARELNSAMADSIGLAQCDLAAGLLAAGTGDIAEARRLLNKSRQTALEMGTGEPVDLVDTLICAALGDHDGAVAAARRLADQAQVDPRRAEVEDV
ncbi:MAG: hypothetical protein QOC94_527, partial [Actinoplanes sp.]|nr:hypothetical protein [Actinoplanes sp.]